MKKFSKFNILRNFLKIIYNLLIILCIIFILIIFTQRLSDSKKDIFGYQIYRVSSGSMEPEYSIDEVVISKKVDSGEINIGDTIIYKGQKGNMKDRIIMHEVTNIYYDENGTIRIAAKGIVNVDEDPEISESQVYGIVILKSGILTFLYNIATNDYMSFVIILVLVINVFLSFRSGKKYNEEDLENSKKSDKNDKTIEDKIINIKVDDKTNSENKNIKKDKE